MASTISAGTTTTTALAYSADTSGVLQLQTNGTTTAVTIDTAQNVGFGVTPSSWSYGSGGKALEFPDAGAIWTYSSSSGINFSQNVYYNGAYYYKNTGAATLYGQGSGSHIWYNAVSGTGGTTFTPTQAMTLSATGSLGVGATPGSIGGDIDVIANQNGIGIGYTTSVYRRMVVQSSNNMAFISGSNTASLSAAGAWTNASDAKLKKNITDIKYGLNTILSTQPRSFERNDVAGEFIGFIAQELKEQIPEVVFGSENEQYTVDYGSLIAVAFKAIQELSAKVTALEAKVA